MKKIFFKSLIKSLIPKYLYNKFKHSIIIKQHKSCQQKFSHLIENINHDPLLEIHTLKQFPVDKKIIWQYWSQGFNSDSHPPLIDICLKSVENHAKGFTIIRISDDNINEYLKLPNWLIKKKSIISKAHFADLLRCILLTKYGGTWLDAAVFLSGDIPQYITESDFFYYQRDNSEKHKKYWEYTFAYYWGWQPNFLVRSLIGIMHAKKGNNTVADFASFLLCFWKNNDYAPDYFFFQILIESYLKKFPSNRPFIVNDTIPHLLRQYINNYPAPEYSISDILEKTPIHSLNYKNDVAYQNLLILFPEYGNNTNQDTSK